MGIQVQHVNPAGTRVYMGQIQHEDLHLAIVRTMKALDVRVGSIQLLGGLTEVEFRTFDFTTKTRRAPVMFSGSMEIVNSQGHLSFYEGEPHVHLHATVTVPHGGIWVAGGHVQRATAFVVEFMLCAYDDINLVRSLDEETGMLLWNLPDMG